MVQIIAMLTMVCDHIGFAFMPQYPGYRIIGRIAMPLYAYLLAKGMTYSKKHKSEKEHIIRILIIAVASQIPYIAFWRLHNLSLNICFGWAIAACFIYTADKYIPEKYQPLLLPAAFLFLMQSAFEYTYLSVGYALIFWMFLIKKDLPELRYLSAIVFTTLYIIQNPSYLFIFHIGGFFLADVFHHLEKKKKLPKIRVPKLYWQSFYPLQYLILTAVRAIIEA